ncbi:MAG: NADPH-dependent F420 reductase [Actinobacteria bacterium]|nr:NADPH-dependent F420 reductase [Actinomycetota bacterium]
MTEGTRREVLGIIGGTGPQGRGLGLRWARAGHVVHIGSRTADKGEEAAATIREKAGGAVEVHGGTNADAAAVAEIVIVSVPYEAQADTLPPLTEAVAGKIVVNLVNPMVFDEVGPIAVPVEAGSAAEECQRLWPQARVVSAFHDIPARRLWRIEEPVDCDVLICSDDDDAAHRVAHLAAQIPGMWGVNCGPLRNSEYIENMTPVLLFINRYYKIHAGLRIEGVERGPGALHAHRAPEADEGRMSPRA